MSEARRAGRRRGASSGLVAVTTLVLACGGGEPERGAAPGGMQLVSPAFESGGPIPVEYTCDGRDASPPLRWSAVPEGTVSFALFVVDPDAPPGTWVHWVIWDLPGDRRQLDEGVPKTESLPDGSAQGATWGVEEFSRVGYQGPCPPPGPAHRYFFKLYALDRRLDMAPGSPKSALEAPMQEHVLAQAGLIGVYGR